MHKQLLLKVIGACRRRIEEGDCPTVEAFSIEILESAVVELSNRATRLEPPPQAPTISPAADSADEGLRVMPLSESIRQMNCTMSTENVEWIADQVAILEGALIEAKRATPAPVPSADCPRCFEVPHKANVPCPDMIVPVPGAEELSAEEIDECLPALINSVHSINAGWVTRLAEQAKRAVPSVGTFSTEISTSPAARKGKLAALNDLVRSGVAVTGFECDPVTLLEGGPPIQRDTTDAVPAGGAVAVPVAVYAGVDMSRYTIEWLIEPDTTGMLPWEKVRALAYKERIPVGTKLYASPIGAGERETIERCAKVCDEWRRPYCIGDCCDDAQHKALQECAAAIRALSATGGDK